MVGATAQPRPPRSHGVCLRRLAALAVSALCLALVNRTTSTLFTVTSSDRQALAGRSTRLPSRKPCVACEAYKAILRRDPYEQDKMQRWIKMQLKVWYRSVGVGGMGDFEKKKEALLRLGLTEKVKQLEQQMLKPWHTEHLKVGDVYKGFFQHPTAGDGLRVDVEVEVTGADKGIMRAPAGEFPDKEVQINADFALTFEKGAQRNRDIAGYMFSKFNLKWRKLSGPLPTEEELNYIGLDGLRIFFKQIAEAENYPSEEEFNKVCADPSKGMSMDEFMNWALDDAPDYLEESVVGFYTGRRMQITDGKLVLDGDFQDTVKGLILGYATYDDESGGEFQLQLAKSG
eukprot:TRINITY_DN123585_c0_g1_i1.p1 TRINITY_DN123585_c0_g1~~TRINITY_DN123585_c0_g1_i1.p1  ORF type:complete len:344 (-),score=112.59 TRINITY_DN123585_c0_g1_i1:302-1333(-)